MSHRHDLDQHRHSLGEIREIMNAMKTLALMETRKLSRFIHAQRAVVDNIEAAATDFIAFHREALPEVETDISLYLLIGTERGFCGDINQRLVRHLDTVKQQRRLTTPPDLIVIGHKLQLLLENDNTVTAYISGANIAEEVVSVLEQIVQQLAALQHGRLTLDCIYDTGEDGIQMTRLLPPFQALKPIAVTYTDPPLLNLSPSAFLLELTDNYLFAALSEMLYTSLLAENHRRTMHLEGAVQHLEEETRELIRASNALRQEEITEEIEVILLSADSLNINRKIKPTNTGESQAE